MKKNHSNILRLALFTFFVSCAHHKDVRPGVEGEHRISVVADSSEEGARDAVSQSQYFCEQRNKTAAFIKEEKKYTGDLDEQSYKSLKKASKIAKVVGGSVWVGGRKRRTQNTGGLIGLGGAVGDIAAGEGYTVKMRFKCI